ILPNGNLVFPPFRAEDYRQEVHAQVYACLAKNQIGSIISRDVNVRAVVAQYYEADVNKEHVIRGNSAVMKCLIPSFVADFVEVVSWHTDQNENFSPSGDFVVSQYYDTDVNKEYVIRGNSAVMKCQIPSFVADFVEIVSWHTDQNESFHPKMDYVVQQFYEAEVNNEYVIRGNSAVLKCSIPSFVADFVSVLSWQDDSGNTYGSAMDSLHGNSKVVNQYYEAEVVSEYVIKGNTAVLKCTIPSFVADFVRVEAWVAHDGTEFLPADNFVVNQYYGADILMEYVIKGNAAVLKCSIPSFVADFVKVESWIDEDGNELVATDNYVVIQPYEAEADNEYVIRGNSVVMKCEVPSFVADFVSVDLWMDSQGKTYYPGNDQPMVVNQFYQTRVIDEFVLKGNAAILKCLLPSFVADFVSIDAWILDETVEINSSIEDNNLVVNQFYQTRVNDEFVLRGNAAILKCLLPSFVADFVLIDAWILDETLEITSSIDEENNFVVNQYYEAQVYDVFVIKGNVAIFKCNIPSFVSDHVEIIEWTDTEGGVYSTEAKFDGKYLVLPSGELHIREVGPEDGYKSYQCRTKHRLTGETRLSATKGRLVITVKEWLI
uniref:Uncharacterized protein n=1 Tax=Phlebotomus papatasi TaxID=29031 RepID=A0A1B0DQ86_PHLPP